MNAWCCLQKFQGQRTGHRSLQAPKALLVKGTTLKKKKNRFEWNQQRVAECKGTGLLLVRRGFPGFLRKQDGFGI